MTLSEKLLALRTEKGLSQEDLAEKLEVSRQSVSKWETAQSTPDLDKIIRLADLFGVTVDELVREGERPQPPEPPQPQVVFGARGQENQKLTAVQKYGGILEVIGAALAIIGLIGEDRLLIYDALPPVILGLPLLLAKERSWLILCWVLMILSFIIFNPYTIQTAWWIPDGLIYLRRYLRNPEYSTYLFGGVVGIIRGLLVLGLLVFTGRACGRAWREKRFPDQKD